MPYYRMLIPNIPESGMLGQIVLVSCNVYEFIPLVPLRLHCYCGIDDVEEVIL